MLLHCFLEKFQRSLPVSRLRNETFPNLAFMIYGPPEVVPLAIDLHEDLVEMPTPAARFHTLDPALSDLGGKHRSEATPPEPDSFVAYVYTGLVQQSLHVAERQRQTNVTLHRQVNDLTTGHEVREWVAPGHRGMLRDQPPPAQAWLF